MSTENNIYVTQSSMPPFDEYIEGIRSLWDSHWLTNMGTYHQKLEHELENFLNCKYVTLFVNGHLALELTLQALKVKGEVITTPFTFASTTHAIVRNGLSPVFCDIDPHTYTMDPAKIETLITDKTCAILPVHVYGNICNIEEIEQIARRHGLRVIYDAAHSFGETYKGENVATFGDVSIFSFHATKVFNCIEGGAATYSNQNLEHELCSLKNFGIESEEVVSGVGSNAKMNEFQAVMGLCNLQHFNEEITKRQKVYQRYMVHLQHIPGLHPKLENPNTMSNYAYFPVLFDEKAFGATRNDAFEQLKKNNIHARKYFYPLTSDFDCFHGQYDSTKTPVAQYVSKRILTLPMYADLPLNCVDQIAQVLVDMKR